MWGSNEDVYDSKVRMKTVSGVCREVVEVVEKRPRRRRVRKVYGPTLV